MLTIIIRDNGEPKVTKYTYGLLWNEIKDIPRAQILISKSWLDGLDKMNPKNKFVSFVEADCLVSSGYYHSLIGLMMKHPDYRHIAVLSSSVAVKVWVNRIYGYEFNKDLTDGLIPITEARYRYTYPVQVGYIPGSLIRVGMLRKLLEARNISKRMEENIPRFSLQLSLGFWGQNINNGIGERVYVSPATTYATTDESVNSIIQFYQNRDVENFELLAKTFRQQMI